MKRLQFHTYTGFVLIYILLLFIDSEILLFTQGVVGMLALLISFKGATRTYQMIGIIFTIISFLLFFIFELEYAELVYYFTSMGLLLSLLYLIPFINHFMIVGKYDQSMYDVLKSNTPNLGKFYVKSYLTSYVLTIFIFLSTIPLVYRFIQAKTAIFNDKITHQFATRGILRPFAAANVWSPIEVYIALVVAITGASYLHLLPILFVFSLIMVLSELALGYFKYRKHELTSESSSTSQASENMRKLSHLGAFLIFFIGTASAVHFIIGLEFFEAIVLIIVPYTIFWSIMINKLRTFIRYNQEVWGDHIWTMQNFVMLLVPVGVFNEIVEVTGIFEGVFDSIAWMEESPLILLIVLMFSSMILAFFGFHPLVTLSLQGIFVTPFLDTINPLSVSVVMIISVVANDMTGTFNVPITMLNQYFKRNPYQLTAWNIGFALLFGAVGVFIGYLIL
ncbi:hypothetical protein CEY16_11080 [Halalkalibacillus sediminis]|uniref:Permease n=1 Tax=Halalkalibacillus sediminis TaxID=2018042 RepID=A0A2I0QSG4_9BACI|nr:hypothetical protein [Halalkalibacillus sediminis]PKR77273.1 hypothetical protein CEY16_11080 [Halalkalibacillus sediminis]